MPENPLEALTESYKRLRHTYGYGVHSPFAFEMLEKILPNRGYSYYAEDEIDNLARSRKERRRAMMIHRLVARYGVHDVWVSPEVSPCLLQAIRKAGTGLKVRKDAADMHRSQFILDCNSSLTPQRIVELLRSADTMIMIQDCGGNIADALGCEGFPGVMFYSPDCLIMASRKGMRFTSYSVRL